MFHVEHSFMFLTVQGNPNIIAPYSTHHSVFGSHIWLTRRIQRSVQFVEAFVGQFDLLGQVDIIELFK